MLATGDYDGSLPEVEPVVLRTGIVREVLPPVEVGALVGIERGIPEE